MPEDHPRQIGPYEILGPLGKGAMGQVYKAVQPSLNRVVALKVLSEQFTKDPARIERFDREAKAVALLSHPNVVQIIDKDTDGELVYFAMEYVPGASLDAVLRQRRLSLHEALTVFKGICRGLEAAHRENITHRDLNPRNVLVSEDLSVVKLADFGISRVESISRAQGTLSTAEVSMGTLHYIAPEQARDMTSVDHRSDIYSAGVALYEMLTGRVPVGRFSLPSQLNHEVPSEFDSIVLKCLAAEPAERYPTVSRLLQDVGRLEDQLRLGLVNELRGLSRSTTKIFRTTRSVAGNRWLMGGLAGAALLGLIGVGGVFLLQGRGGDAATDPAAELEIPVAEDAAAGNEGTDLSAAAGGAATATPGGKAAAPAATAAASKTPPAPAPTSRTSGTAAAERDLEVLREQVGARLYEPALAGVENFLAAHGSTPLALDAYFLRADIFRAEDRAEEAMATYVRIKSAYPSHQRAAEAGFELAKLSAASRDKTRKEQAVGFYTEVADGFPQSDWAPRALAARAELEQEAKSHQLDAEMGTSVPSALVTYRRLAETYPGHPATEEALWRLGEMYGDLKRFELAAAAYAELGERFPATAYDAWWEAGQVLDRKLDDPERAIEAYSKVPPTSRRHDDAQKRISRLSR